ncbi:shikimate dehydrogenase [Amnibacterium kyonggiense]|uniref:Shikimate 5-dehydrogenase n=1 Tax=Amnibacterium kyonggiense TaxID=595671 RepID=A0A4V3EB13_9MICO|nr:shikimate dehydrogenase [Amnibacterium kyonggiense]TDS79914.1 shikimate 5-dehydrogenase [Amnibacterium kyonggiense]
MTALDTSAVGPLQVLTADTLVPAERPTLYFLGVSTGSSSIQRVFPAWAAELGLDGAVLRGIDLPVGAPSADTRRIVEFLGGDDLGLGMQITSHKIAVGTAARDLFTELRPLATLMGEVSCVTKQDDGLHGFAKDPVAGALALDAIVPADHWSTTGAPAVVLGAGGAGTALAWCLVREERGQERPSALVVTDTDGDRLEHLAEIARTVGPDVPLELVRVRSTDQTDAVLAAQPAGSLVVNATGLGKDLPGSPIGQDALLPRDAIAWDLNYRGDLRFLETAIRQTEDRGVRAEDGWTYFVHGWLQAVKEVFGVDVPTSGPDFDRLSDLARAAR